MPRLFAGIDLPETIRDRLSDLAEPLPGVSWVPDDDLHITLRFVGDVEGLAEREFTDSLAEIVADAFEIRLEGLGTFGGKDPRTLWAGVSRNPQLEALARACDRAARNAGLPPDTKPFKAHVTIARLRSASPEVIARYLERVGMFATEPFSVGQFELFSAKPKVGGGPYVVEAEFPLRGGFVDAEDDPAL